MDTNPDKVSNSLIPLAVHLVSHDPGSGRAPGALLAREFYSRLSRGPRPTGIPIRHWTASFDPTGILVTPNQLPLAEAKRNVIVLLIDQPFFDARDQWRKYLEDLINSQDKQRDLLLPVSICGNAHRIATGLKNVNCITVADPEAVVRDEQVFQAIFTAILRFFPETSAEDRPTEPDPTIDSLIVPPLVFLCHAKSDGDGLARQIRQYIYEKTQLACFFDTHDIPHGRPVKQSIQESISRSCLLIIWTDQLLESRWCQFEILEARKQQRPIVVLDALAHHAPRIFPFLGNMPVFRWCGDVGIVVSALLQELIRTRYVRSLFEVLSAKESNRPIFMLHPPDLMEVNQATVPSRSCIEWPTSVCKLLVYPDPPLPADEIEFLAETFPNLALHSLSEWTALRAAGELGYASEQRTKRPIPLSGLSIGLSISETDNWKDYGLISEHQDEFALDLSRELILLGARLFWGGDLRPDGLGIGLEKLVRAYHQADHAPQDHIACYLAWPIHQSVNPIELQKRRVYADLICLRKPNIPDGDKAAFNAICYSQMRQHLADKCKARVILGGKLKGYAGRYPGVVEEVLETIKRKKPVYIVGGFGGASRAVYDAISRGAGEIALRQAWDEHCKSPKTQEMHKNYRIFGEQLMPKLTIDYDSALADFTNLGLGGLSHANRLTEEENLRLANSRDIHEILALLVKGLSRLDYLSKDGHEV